MIGYLENGPLELDGIPMRNRFTLLCIAVTALASLDPSAGIAETWKRHTIDSSDRVAGKRGADGVRTLDVNGDGRLDITTGWEEGGAVVVYLNPGPDQVHKQWPSVTVGSVKGVEDAVSIDLDKDGAIDVVSCAEGKINSIFVHWAPMSPTKYLRAESWKTEAFPESTGRRWMFALPMDMNQDGRVDLVIGSKNTDAVIGWLENPPNSKDTTSWKLHTLAKASWIMSIQAVDLNADNFPDILYSDRFGKQAGIYWLKNPGHTSAEWERQLIGGQGKQVMFLTSGKLSTTDQAPTIICATLTGELLCYKAESTGNWTETILALPFGLKAGKGVAIADVNGDHRPDVVTTAEAQREKKDMVAVAWKENGTNGWVDHAISDQRGRKFDRLEMMDLDGDGDLDLITCEEVHDLGVFWYENPTR
ncbi:MAG: hypothetical protein CMM01_06005 [Rhodopirellula sp.]|nr:hypothetical protein [Rhodopirellula sp.]OUX52141.1 MAG: hypothetical protein CBE43_01560 [Rhodopirellula sp. TMED283]